MAKKVKDPVDPFHRSEILPRLIAILCICRGLVPMSYAADTPDLRAIFKTVRGKVLVGVKDNIRIARVGGVVHENEFIQTSKNALALVQLGSGTVIKMDAGSVLQVGRQTSKHSEVFLRRGAVFTKVIPTKKRKHRFKLNTRTATMGVRGTQFYSAISSVKGHKGDLWMCVNEGEVEIENTKTHHKEIVKEGEGVALPRGKEITAPKPFEWTKNLNWAMDPSSKDLVNRASFESEYAKDILNQEYD